MLGSLTVLPALLSRLGDNVDRLHVPFVGRLRRDDGEGRIWGAIIDRVLRRPVLSVVLAGGLLVALALPALQLRLVAPGPETFPQVLAVVKTYNRMQQAFPGTALPANVVVKAQDVNAPAVRDAIDRLEQRALASGRMHEPITVAVNDDATVANVTVPVEGNGTDDESIAALAELREEIVPETVGALPNAESAVTGASAQWKDSTDKMKSTLPLVVAFVLAVRVRADAGRLPLARDRGQGDRAQPALGGRRLRRAGARLPARLRQGAGSASAPPPGSTRWCRSCCS